jgi:hypothetical protein
MRLCRGHHREVHRSGDQAAWWANVAIDPTGSARSLWLRSHPLPAAKMGTEVAGSAPAPTVAADTTGGSLGQSTGQRSANNETRPRLDHY